MKKSELKKIIKEEISKTLNENLESSLEMAGFEVNPIQAWIVRDEKSGNEFIAFTESGDYRCIKLGENLPGSIVGEDIEDFVEQFVEQNS